MVSEWAVFSRRGDRAYYVQYAREGVLESEPIPDTFLALVDSFEFGPTPSGQVDPDLLAASLEPYQDGAFRLLVPTFWPLVDRADDGSSITFVEIGGLGYLTIFARDGATGFAANDIIAAWRNEWAKEKEFKLIQDLHPVQIDGRAGVGLEYSWLDEGNTGWTRRLIALIEDDTLYAVAVDYVTSGYERRADTLRAILSSFEILEAMIEDESEADHAPDSEAPPVPTPEPEPEPEPEPQPEQPTTQPQVDERLFREPTSDESVIFLGRALTRYQPEGSALIQEEWISNARVYVRVGNDEYLGATDSDGYIYVSNLPQLSGGAFYELSRIEAPMFGFQQPVAITFQHLQVGQIAPRVAYLGIVEVTLESDRTLSVELRRPAGEGAASRSSLEHFINTFSTSAWVPFVREAIVYRDRM